MTPLIEFTLLAFGSLFVIVDPIAVVPGFLAITPNDTPQQRERMARMASFVMAGVLLAFALLGKWIFKFVGITLPAFQIAGSIILLLVALDMLKAQRSRVQETREETEAAAQKMDIAKRHYDEKTFRYELNDDAMATEKTADGIRKFAVDIVKLEALVAAKLK